MHDPYRGANIHAEADTLDINGVLRVEPIRKTAATRRSHRTISWTSHPVNDGRMLANRNSRATSGAQLHARSATAGGTRSERALRSVMTARGASLRGRSVGPTRVGIEWSDLQNAVLCADVSIICLEANIILEGADSHQRWYHSRFPSHSPHHGCCRTPSGTRSHCPVRWAES